MDPVQALEVARAFKDEAEQIYLLYRDALAALGRYREAHVGLDPDTIIEYQAGDHAVAPSTVGGLLVRSAPNGRHEVLLANLALVTLFELWEHRRRGELAEAISVRRDAVTIPALGDLRRFRNAIVHPVGDALTDLAKCEVMPWFRPGDPVRFGPSQVEEVIGRVRSGVDEFVLRALAAATA